MPATSLVRFMHQKTDAQGEPLNWGRADIDGAPYRGPINPMLTSDEADDRLTRVADTHNAIFDTSIPEENKRYLEVLDKAANGWGQILVVKRRTLPVTRTYELKDPESQAILGREVVKDFKVKVYIEWVEFYMQDGQPMQSQRPYLGRPNE